MPRKAPDKVIEHRITLGAYEREELRQVVRRYKATSVADSVGSVLQGIGWPVLAAAALIYAGFNLDEFIDSTKNAINRTSDGVVSFIEGNELVVYTAPYIGREIEQVEIRKAAIYRERQEYLDANADVPGIFSSAKVKGYNAKLQRLEAREVVLREMLDKIARGDASAYSYVDILDSFGITTGFRDRDQAAAAALQEFYEEEGGVGEFDRPAGQGE